jgi:hypothetical protein
MTASVPAHQGLSASPPFSERNAIGSNVGITLNDSPGIQSQNHDQDYADEPPSSTDKPVSGHPALLAQHLMVGHTIPLARLAAEFTGCAARSEGRNGTLAPLTTAELCPALKRIPQPAALSIFQPHFSER